MDKSDIVRHAISRAGGPIILTRELVILEYDFQRGRVLPDRLTRSRHARYAVYADRMLRVYRTGVGRFRRDLHADIHNIFAAEDDCPLRRIRAFCKLLDDRSTFADDRSGEAAQLRQKVFRAAAAKHPLVRSKTAPFEHEELAVKKEIAQGLGRSWADVDRALFADLPEFQPLEQFVGFPDGAALLSRYNVAQVQGALFDAVSLTVWASEDFKSILRYAKLARLMHTIRRTGPGRYAIQLDGPASVLGKTRRYGAAMACFLPGLLSCRDWRMHAVVATRRAGWQASLDLSSEDGLQSHVAAPPEFDSELEATFAAKWGDAPRSGWSMQREGDILHDAQRTFVPDFTFRHADGRSVLLEIVGFWTPEYLAAKLATVRAFAGHQLLLAIPENLAQTTANWTWPAEVLRFKSTLRVKDVLDRLEAR